MIYIVSVDEDPDKIDRNLVTTIKKNNIYTNSLFWKELKTISAAKI